MARFSEPYNDPSKRSRREAFKGYDKEAARQVTEQTRRISGRRRLAQLTDIVTIDESTGASVYNDISVVLDDAGNVIGSKPRYFDPKSPVEIQDGDKTLYDFGVDFDSVTPDNARPAPLTVRPTASTNAKRPYTVAAGWERYPRQSGPRDENLGTLTTLFRDGTLWNYYDVEYSFWVKFSSSFSKGQYISKGAINPELTNNYRHGPADLTGVRQDTLNLIYTEARVAQYRYASKRKYTYTNKLTGEKRQLAPGRVPKSAQGRNTATANRPRKPK